MDEAIENGVSMGKTGISSEADFMDLNPDQLVGHWVEVREESGPGRIVLRPENSDIPPARGRRNLVLERSGATQDARPGPDDRPVFSGAGLWKVEGARLNIQSGQFAGNYRVEMVSPDKLVLVRE